MESARKSHLRQGYELPKSFSDWQDRVRRSGAVPVIAVAGSRGKSTVIRLIDAIFTGAGLKTATWTDQGVEIRGRRQRGELMPWSRALQRLAAGSLDIAIQELDWSTVRAVGLPAGLYPVAAITNLCANNEECLITPEARRATEALPTVLRAVHHEGVAVLNGEDYALAGAEVPTTTPVILIAQKRETPLVRSQFEGGGIAGWVGDRGITIGDALAQQTVCDPRELPFAVHGAASFQVTNALVAAASALATGIPPETIERALLDFAPDPLSMPNTFSVMSVGGVTIVVDRPDPSWFLRPILRAVRDIPRVRLMTVAGRMATVPDNDLPEVGRLLGRISTVVVLHSQNDDNRSELLRQGVALNELPPLVLRTTTERRGVRRALRAARTGDAILILADNAPAVIRSVQRAALNPALGGDEEGLD
jgi:cyanophycin synthetase